MRTVTCFFVVFLQIANCVQSLGVCELGMMKNWTEAQIKHQGLILIGTLKTCTLSRTKRQLLLCPCAMATALQTALLTIPKDPNVLRGLYDAITIVLSLYNHHHIISLAINKINLHEITDIIVELLL